MPGLTLINADTGKPWILKHRIYIPAVYGALKKAVNQSGIKGDRNVGAIPLVFHGAGMKRIGIVKYINILNLFVCVFIISKGIMSNFTTYKMGCFGGNRFYSVFVPSFYR